MTSPMSKLRPRARSDRPTAMSTVFALIVVIIIVAGMSVGAFSILGGFSAAKPAQCSPPTSPTCGNLLNLHDVSVLAPFKSAAQGSQVSFTASLPQGETASSFTFNFGDGSAPLTTSSDVVTHTYNAQGQYLIYVTAQVGAHVHDNLQSLVLLKVTQSAAVGTEGSTPGLSTEVVANTTTPSGSPTTITTVLAPGQGVTVSGSYTGTPTNPLYTDHAPTIVVSQGGQLTSGPTTATSAEASATFGSPGDYEMTFVASSTNSTATVYQNYTWTVFVAPAGEHAAIYGSVAPQSPHPGTIIVYEEVPGGAASEDPAIDYETAGAEPISNIYQTLITYNGTDVGPSASNFVPVASTCVPGSAQCAALYGGDTLVNGTNYTFVIQPNAVFYDPATQAHWPMYPTDVEFSIARDLGFSTLPFPTDRPGWIVAQALLSPGNESWDLIHQAYNNTPQNIMGAMTVNGSYCPQSARQGADARGCITFDADGSGHPWPDFLELIADPLGAGIVSCGWFSAKAQGAGIPFWTAGNISGAGDQPCAQIGTDGMGVPVSHIPAEGWDEWEELGSGAFGPYLGNVQWNMVGSGPYYLSTYIVGASYSMGANPYYQQNPYCTWTGCQPKAGQYAGKVEVTWETSETPGEEALKFGAADAATIPSTSIGLELQLIQQGKLNAIQVPTLDIGFQAFDLTYSIAGAQHYSTNTITAASDFFTYLGMREFFARAYPYATIENTIETKDGIQESFNEGGAIPQFMGTYYPSNIPWPDTDPCTSATDSACPAYWWAQMHDPTSAYYDPEVANCTSGNPCTLPIFTSAGNPVQDEINQLWVSEISTLSGGAIRVYPVDINFVDLIGLSESAVAGQNAMPIYSLGWAPDYPDPTDYVVPLYAPNSTFTAGDAVANALEQPQFDSNCAMNLHDYAGYANLSMTTGIPQYCQGVAYRSMVYALGIASDLTNLTERQVIYDQAEEIAYGLCLYVYSGQDNAVPAWASWVNINSIDTNVMATGTYYGISGNGVWYAGST